MIVSNSSKILSKEIFTITHELGYIIYDFENEINFVRFFSKLKETHIFLEQRKVIALENYLIELE